VTKPVAALQLEKDKVSKIDDLKQASKCFFQSKRANIGKDVCRSFDEN
jgi:hypothetical protein